MVAGLEGKRIALTGASGFIGKAALRALVAGGAEATALLRGRHGADAVEAAGARAVRAPLVTGPALVRGLTGIEVLVHLAYDVRADAAANLAAFDALLAAAQEAGVRHIVHASSVVVYDDWPASALTEASPIGVAVASGYRAAKIAMEQRLLAGPIPATILQPTIVWGAGSDLWTERPIRALRGGGFVLPEPCGLAPLVHVDDVASAIARAAALSKPASERLLVTGPESPPWEALLEGYRAIAGGSLIREPADKLRAALGPVPPPSAPSGPSAAARISAALRALLGRKRFDSLLDLAARLRPAAGPLRPGRADLALFTASPRIDTRKAQALLGWQPAIGLDGGLALLRADFAARVPE